MKRLIQVLKGFPIDELEYHQAFWKEYKTISVGRVRYIFRGPRPNKNQTMTLKQHAVKFDIYFYGKYDV
jgi:hypothetical protein